MASVNRRSRRLKIRQTAKPSYDPLQPVYDQSEQTPKSSEVYKLYKLFSRVNLWMIFL